MYKNNQYIIPDSIFWPEILRKDIPKSGTTFQPIFEAFTNSIEAIRDRQKINPSHKGKISIDIYTTEAANPDNSLFARLSITDNGIGFNETQFQRFNTFRDNRKNYKNLGSGRLQFVHFFDSTIVKSTFEENGEFFERDFIVSKNKAFLKNNAIVKHKTCKKISSRNIETKISFNALLEKSPLYDELTDKYLKKKLVERYIHYFCYNREKLPEIVIRLYNHSELKSEIGITEQDIPKIDIRKDVKVQYSKKVFSGIETTGKTEDFRIDAFKIDMKTLKENKLNLVSKGEVIEESPISLQNLTGSENIKGNKYLFLVSSNYIDDRDTNIRGVLNIPTKESFLTELFPNEEEILVEDIQEKVNDAISKLYPEIEEVKQKHEEGYNRLKEMFLLDDDMAKEISVSINDSESKILEKFYEAEAKKTASLDAAIKASIDNLEKLDTRNPNYAKDLEMEIDRLVRTIPLQNKRTLTHYVARRKLVLDLLDKILSRKLEVQKEKENYDEALIHNLLFQKGSTNTENSDLWIINEDFIYFKGSSEKQLSNLEIDGHKVFKSKFTEEEERYLTSLGENRKIRRPDVLLFPEEGKCIIIEFKAPQVNASDHLTQIDRYANLIRNYTDDKFQITTFYGFLLGENIEPRDVLGTVSRYEHSYQFDYIYRPSENVIGFDGRSNGSIYTEVIKYTTLLQRAKQRNRIFIEKLK